MLRVIALSRIAPFSQRPALRNTICRHAFYLPKVAAFPWCEDVSGVADPRRFPGCGDTVGAFHTFAICSALFPLAPRRIMLRA